MHLVIFLIFESLYNHLLLEEYFMMKQKGKILILFFLFTMLFLTSPPAIAPDDLVYSQYFDSTDVGSWDPMNEWNATYGFWDGKLHIDGMVSQWDDFLLTDPIFNLPEYTIKFHVYLKSGYAYGTDQFHFILNYNTGYAVMELGSDVWACHYIDSNDNWSYLNYSFPLDQWMKVQIAAKDGKLDLWIDGEYIHSEKPFLNAPVLEQIGFGLFEYSSAQFDDLEVYSSYQSPDGSQGGFKPEDFAIHGDDTFTYQLIRYSGSETEANLTGWFRDVSTEESMPFYLSVGDEFEMTIFEIWESGVVVDIYKNDIYEGQVKSNFFFLPIYSDLSNFKMFEGVPLAENSEQYFVIANEGNIGSTTPCVLEFYWDISNGVLTNLELTSGSLTFEDGSIISDFYMKLEDSSTGPGRKFGISVEDTFIYQLEEYAGSEPELDLTGWFRDDSSETALNFSLAPGDELKLIVLEFIDYRVRVSVYKNNNHIGEGLTDFFFLPINDITSDFEPFESSPLNDAGDTYFATLPENYTGSTTPVQIEFTWYKDSGILSRIELMSGVVTRTDGSTISSFVFELTEAQTTPKDTYTNPLLTPAWELIPSLICLLALPIAFRKKRNR
jgi:hypothetical protein